MSLAPGTRLGPYEILSPLGAGGMGEVYRARDGKLHREVAIKVLPEAVAQDADRLGRFQREAQVLASLNHPHIASIYGLEKTGNVEALVLELVEGETLADRIAAGPIPLDEALAIARQITDALEAAHEKGIVHRDLKPANVKVTPEGKVKVLDFGLAKALTGDASSPDQTHSPTLTAAATQAGVVIGTAAYMSPEQARGKSVDKRADIWAFGAVLYEMLAGRKAFEGETVSDTLAAVLRADIDWSGLPPETPQAVRTVLRRCLDRDPKHRLRDIGDARIALEDLASSGESSPRPIAEPPPVGARRPAWPWLAAVVAALLAGAAAGRLTLRPRGPAAPPVRFEIAAGAVSSAAISPDGRQLAIASRGKLWVRDLARLEIRAIEGTDGAVRPFWSRDGRTIAFGARGKLWKVATESGVPSVICELASGLWDDDAGGAWLADGTIVFSNGNAGLWQVSSQGGDPIEILKPDPRTELHFHNASGLPDGRSVVYVIHRSGEGAGGDTLGLWSAGKAHVLVTFAGQSVDDPVFSPSGHLLFTRSPTNAGVWALPFSLAKLQPSGEAFLVSPGTRAPSVAADGTLVVLPPLRRRPLGLAWADRAGKIVGRIDEPRLRQTSAAISPDGGRVAVVEITDGKADIWLYDLERGTRNRITTDGGAESPSWLPDGRSVVYESRSTAPKGTTSLKRTLADGSGRVEKIGEGSWPKVSRDGRVLFYTLIDKDGMRLWNRPFADVAAKPAAFISKAFYSITAAPSPDGRFVAYEALSGPGASDVFLRRFPPSEDVWQVSSNGGESPRWSQDGRLFFARGPEVFEVQVATDSDVRIGAPTLLFQRKIDDSRAVAFGSYFGGSDLPSAFDVSPDGKRFLVYEPAGDVTEDRIMVALNWFGELRRGTDGTAR